MKLARLISTLFQSRDRRADPPAPLPARSVDVYWDESRILLLPVLVSTGHFDNLAVGPPATELPRHADAEALGAAAVRSIEQSRSRLDHAELRRLEAEALAGARLLSRTDLDAMGHCFAYEQSDGSIALPTVHRCIEGWVAFQPIATFDRTHVAEIGLRIRQAIDHPPPPYVEGPSHT